MMEEEINDFCLSNHYPKDEVIVHHKDFQSTNNLRSNLQVMNQEEHDKIHNRDLTE
jgi:hypothetical protein